jgi:tetratricopeptide (TPR) repeat protein
MQAIQDASATGQDDVADKLGRIETYLAQDPANAELLAQAIDLSLTAGQVERAMKHADEALAYHPGDVFFLARRGNVLLAAAEWKKAVDLFSQLVQSHSDPVLEYNLAYAFFRLERYADVCALLLPLAQTADAASVTLLLKSLHHQGDVAAAVALAEAQMSRCESDAAFLSAASLACFDGGALALARRFSDEALQRDTPAPVEALVTGGSLALADSDAQTASRYFQAVLDRVPDEGRSWSGLGTASLLLQDLDGARKYLEKAVEFMPRHIGSWHLLAWCRLFARELAGAQAAFQAALALDRNFGDSHGGLAVTQALLGHRAEAQESIDRALGLDRTSLSARYAQMILDGQTEDRDRFRALALRALAGHQGLNGESLADIARKHGAREAGSN